MYKMPDNKFKPFEEWFKQSEYDLETAEAMFLAGNYIYTVFMCHFAMKNFVAYIEWDP